MPHTFTTRADLALAVPDGGCFIELGVAAGCFAEQIIRRNPRLHYIGIDRWSDHHNQAEMQTAWTRLLSALRWDTHPSQGAPLGIGFSLHRSTFAAAVHRFCDRSIDLIYIDGYAHTGQEDGQTLWDWWPKVKPGGILAGHDYCPKYPLTVHAVNTFAAAIDAPVHIIQEPPFNTWYIVKEAA